MLRLFKVSATADTIQQKVYFVEENFKIAKALQHKTSDETSPKHQEFLSTIEKRIAAQQTKVKHTIFADGI